MFLRDPPPVHTETGPPLPLHQAATNTAAKINLSCFRQRAYFSLTLLTCQRDEERCLLTRIKPGMIPSHLQHVLFCLASKLIERSKSLGLLSPSVQEGPVQLLLQMQVKPAGFSTQVAPFIHGDDKHACSTDEGDTECGRDDTDAQGWRSS